MRFLVGLAVADLAGAVEFLRGSFSGDEMRLFADERGGVKLRRVVSFDDDEFVRLEPLFGDEPRSPVARAAAQADALALADGVEDKAVVPS